MPKMVQKHKNKSAYAKEDKGHIARRFRTKIRLDCHDGIAQYERLTHDDFELDEQDEDLQQELEKALQEVSQLDESLELQRSEREKQLVKVQKLKEKSKEERDGFAGLLKRLNTTEDLPQGVADQLLDEVHVFRGLETELDGRFATMQDQHDELKDAHESLRSQHEEQRLELEEVRERCDSLQGKYDTSQNQMTALTQKHGELEFAHGQLQEGQKSLVRERDDFEEERDELRSQLDEVTTKFDNLTVEHVGVKSERDKFKTHCDELGPECQRLEKLQEGHSTRVSELEATNRDLQAQLNGAQASLESERQSHRLSSNDQGKELENLLSEATKLAGENARNLSLRNQAVGDRAILESKLRIVARERDVAVRRLTTRTDEEITRLKTELAKIKAEKARLEDTRPREIADAVRQAEQALRSKHAEDLTAAKAAQQKVDESVHIADKAKAIAKAQSDMATSMQDTQTNITLEAVRKARESLERKLNADHARNSKAAVEIAKTVLNRELAQKHADDLKTNIEAAKDALRLELEAEHKTSLTKRIQGAEEALEKRLREELGNDTASKLDNATKVAKKRFDAASREAAQERQRLISSVEAQTQEAQEWSVTAAEYVTVAQRFYSDLAKALSIDHAAEEQANEAGDLDRFQSFCTAALERAQHLWRQQIATYNELSKSYGQVQDLVLALDRTIENVRELNEMLLEAATGEQGEA